MAALPKNDDGFFGEPGPSHSSIRTVLLVEDEALIRWSMADALRADGFRVIEAASGIEGARILNAFGDIDLLFTDVAIPPGPNGLELAAGLRSTNPDVPIIIGTAYELDEQAFRLADLYVRKPYDPDALSLQVRRLIERRLARRTP